MNPPFLKNSPFSQTPPFLEKIFFYFTPFFKKRGSLNYDEVTF